VRIVEKRRITALLDGALMRVRLAQETDPSLKDFDIEGKLIDALAQVDRQITDEEFTIIKDVEIIIQMTVTEDVDWNDIMEPFMERMGPREDVFFTRYRIEEHEGSERIFDES
jgi:hypothetical protein